MDPAFLKGINLLRRIGTHLLAHGEPQYRFELKPVPTPGLTDTVLTLDGQKLHYYNQRETWQAMTWPASNFQDPGTRLQWQTEKAGTNKNYEFGSRLGWLRMLEHARVVPIDSATFDLAWHAAPDTRALNVGRGASPAEGTDAQQATGAESRSARDAGPPASAGMDYPIHYLMRTEHGQGPLEMLHLRGFVIPAQVFVGRATAEVPRTEPTRKPLRKETHVQQAS